MKELKIAETLIRRDSEGRYCLNDLHKAAGGERRHEPNGWMRNQQTQELMAEISNTGIPVLTQHGGSSPGTFVAKPLVYAYAMWVSPRFHLAVIEAYDRLVVQGDDVGVPSTRAAVAMADRMVSAQRIFSAAFRVCLRLGMERRRAFHESVACAERHTGTDWSSELHVALGIDTAPCAALPSPDSEVALFLQQWEDGALGIPYQSTLTRKLHEHYVRYCATQGNDALNQMRFVQAIKRQFGKDCNPRHRWTDTEGKSQGPHGFIDPPSVKCVALWDAADLAEEISPSPELRDAIIKHMN